MNFLTILAFVASVFMGISIGASTVASAFGPVNSSGSSNVLRSALLAGFFALLGALTQGQNVTQTVGSGIIIGGIDNLQALVILFVAASLVIASVLTDYPMPTAFTVIGAVVGAGLGASRIINWSSIINIVGYWLLVPFLALALGYSLAKLMRSFLPENGAERKIRYLMLISGSYVAYSAGASAVGLAVGPLTGMGYSSFLLLLLGGISILVGAWTYSPRIIRAVSFDYSNIGPRRSVAALGAAAILAQVGIYFGIPISFNEAVIASIIGSGLVEGKSNVGRSKIMFTVVAWAGAFFLSIILAYIASYLVMAI